jgi:hypothetical protein
MRWHARIKQGTKGVNEDSVIWHIDVQWKQVKFKPALHDVGGSFCRSFSSLRMRFDAMTSNLEGERKAVLVTT